MNLLKQTEKYYWALMILGIFLGLFYPKTFIPFEGYIIYIIMTIMGLLFLKVDIIDVITHVKKPFLILYINIINLIFIPILVYFLFPNLDPSVKMATFLLAALPTGVSSAVFTDIMKGKTSLNLTIVITSNLLSIFTIPLLFYIFYNTTLNLDLFTMFVSLSKIIFIPFIIAKIIKLAIIPKIITQLQSYLNLKIILLLSCMITISFAVGSASLLSSTENQLTTIAILFLIFLLFQFIGYFSLFWKSKEEKLAISNSCMIMNNILGIVLAVAFFDITVLNIVILSLIPWNIMIMIKHLYSRFLP